MAVAVAVGGSTNAVLHLLAIAREAEVPLTIDDLDAVCAAHAAHRRPEAGRQVRHVRPAQDRRRAGGAEGAAHAAASSTATR